MNKVQKINSAEKVILHQWLQGLLFSLYACNAGPVDGTDISLSVVDISTELSFPLNLSPERLMEGNSEEKHALDHFEALSLTFLKTNRVV